MIYRADRKDYDDGALNSRGHGARKPIERMERAEPAEPRQQAIASSSGPAEPGSTVTMALRLAKALAALGLGLGLSGCLTTQPPGLDPADETARQKAATDRQASTYPLVARYDACVRAAFADQYQKNVEKGAAVDLAFAACAADEQALNKWFTEYPVASAPIRASMTDRKSRLKAELIARYP